MKKALKYVLLIILALVIPQGAALVCSGVGMLMMKPLETGAVPHTDIYALKNKRNNVFAFEVGSGYALIDAGSDAAELEEALAQLRISAANVQHVMLTHSDGDHVAALSLFPNAAVYMSEDEARMVNRTARRSGFRFNSLPEGISLDNVTLLEENQILYLGKRRVQCVKAPGHTPGSMVYCLDDKYLFTGDCLRIKDGASLLHPFTMDRKTAQASIAQIEKFSIGRAFIFTSHYGYLESEA